MKRHYPAFSEQALEVLDFARCQRVDGSFYGTSGQCRKGKEVGPREIKELQAKAKAGDSGAKKALEKLSKTEDPEKPGLKPSATQEASSAIKPAPKPVESQKKPEQGRAEDEKKDGELGEKSKKALRNLNREEQRVKEEIKSLEEALKNTSEWSSDYDRLDTKLWDTKDKLDVLAADKKAIENGALESKGKPLNSEQKARVSAKLDELGQKIRERTATDQEREKYDNLKRLRDSEDVQATAKAIRELTKATKEYENAREEDLRLIGEGKKSLGLPLRDAKEKQIKARDELDALSQSKEERFGKYLEEYKKGGLAPSKDAWKSKEELDAYTKDWQKRNGLDDVTAAHDRYHSAIHSYLGRSSEDFARASGTKGITPMEEILVNYVNQHVASGGGRISGRESLLEDARYMKDSFIEGGEIRPGSKADRNWDRSALQAARIYEAMSRRKDFQEFITQLSSYPDPYEE